MLGLVAAGAAAGCLGGVFSERLDALTHLAPIWLACGLGALVLGALFARAVERKAIVALGLAAVVAVGALMAPELLAAARQPPPASGITTVKLVQFNLWAENHDPEGSLAWILAQKADVVLVEEGGGQSAWTVRQLHKTYRHVVSCDGDHACDTWIVSRWPMTARRGFRQDGQPLAGAWATLRRPEGDFTVAAAHFVWPIPAGRQQAQSRILVANLARFDHDSLIVAGDFNSTPWSAALRRQDKALGLERRTRALASWPSGDFSRLARAPFPLLPIDHVYAGKAWKTVSVERGPALGSDHRPVVVTLTQ
ncbi:endonuclease/exonuclease/phosphatase family protein [soil metagenome]